MPETNCDPRRVYQSAIVRRMKALGVYKKEFLATIQRTAALYVQLDELDAKFSASGENTVVPFTNKAGATNLVKNPLVCARDDVYTQLLAHERELGLTPAALKKINDAQLKGQKGSTLGEALKALSG